MTFWSILIFTFFFRRQMSAPITASPYANILMYLYVKCWEGLLLKMENEVTTILCSKQQLLSFQLFTT